VVAEWRKDIFSYKRRENAARNTVKKEIDKVNRVNGSPLWHRVFFFNESTIIDNEAKNQSGCKQGKKKPQRMNEVLRAVHACGMRQISCVWDSQQWCFVRLPFEKCARKEVPRPICVLCAYVWWRRAQESSWSWVQFHTKSEGMNILWARFGGFSQYWSMHTRKPPAAAGCAHLSLRSLAVCGTENSCSSRALNGYQVTCRSSARQNSSCSQGYISRWARARSPISARELQREN
jgi:hypothetical protein